MKKKIFYWCPFIDKVATIKAVINSCCGLKRYSNNLIPVIINCFSEFDEHEKFLSRKNINVINLTKFRFIKKIPNKGFFFSRILYLTIFLFSFIPLTKLIKKEEPEYFISHLITSLPLISFNFFKFKTKHILRISGFPKLNILRSLLWRMSSKNIHMITCPTEGTLNILRNSGLFNTTKIFLLEDPIIDVSKLNLRKEILEEEFLKKNNYILGVGRLTKQKNFELLIKFFLNIQKKDPEIRLVIIGEGENYKNLKNLIFKNELQNKVFLLGYKKNVYKYMNNSKFFILSSKWEDPGFVLVEAAASRTVILSSDCPNGPKEILSNGKNGILFNNNDIKDLVNKYHLLEEMNLQEVEKMKVNAFKNLKKYTIFFHTKKLKKFLT